MKKFILIIVTTILCMANVSAFYTTDVPSVGVSEPIVTDIVVHNELEKGADTEAPEPTATPEPVSTPANIPLPAPAPISTPAPEPIEENLGATDSGYKLNVIATAYTHTGNQTSTQIWPEAGRTIAVDPQVIPYGSRVLIIGHEYIAEDCGDAIKGNRIDIFMDSEAECDEWGVKPIEIEVFE